jgi:hypothetical protein
MNTGGKPDDQTLNPKPQTQVVSLTDMPRPFAKLKALDMDAVAQQVSLQPVSRFCCSPSLLLSLLQTPNPKPQTRSASGLRNEGDGSRHGRVTTRRARAAGSEGSRRQIAFSRHGAAPRSRLEQDERREIDEEAPDGSAAKGWVPARPEAAASAHGG